MSWIILLALLAAGASLALVVACPLSRRLATLGSIAGLMFALWVIVPMVFDRFRIYSLDAGSFLLVMLPLALAHTVTGYALLGVASLPWAVAWLWTRKAAPREAWLLGVAYCVLPLLYSAAAVVADVLNTVQPPIARVGWPSISVGLAGYALVAGTAAFSASTHKGRSAMRLASRRVAVLGVAVAVAVAVFRLPDEPLQAGPPPTPTVRASPSSAAPLLVIGLDGANWRVMDDAIASGAVPTLAHLKATGVSGVALAADEPYWSAPAWASIVTGHDQAEHGIYQNLRVTLLFTVPGQLELAPSPLLSLVNLGVWSTILNGWSEPAVFDREHLQSAPVWERLTQAGLNVGVVRFPFTYPARGQAAMLVTDRIQTDLWRWLGVLPGNRADVAWPEPLAALVLSTFDALPQSFAAHFEPVLEGTGGPVESDFEIDPRVLAEDEVVTTARTFDVAQRLLEYGDDTDVLFVYVSGTDAIDHANWPYAFPEDFPDQDIPSRDIDRLSGLMRSYLAYFDTRLAELIGRFPTPPNVLIVSDHGMRAVPNHPVWKAWHAEEGLFIAAGPDVGHTAQPRVLQLVDFAPIIFDLLKLERPDDFTGQGSLDTSPNAGQR